MRGSRGLRKKAIWTAKVSKEGGFSAMRGSRGYGSDQNTALKMYPFRAFVLRLLERFFVHYSWATQCDYCWKCVRVDRYKQTNEAAMRHIRIVKIPPGDAPKRIRAAWVGITLQLADLKMPQPTVWLTTSVLRKDRGWLARFKRFFGVLIDQPAMVSVYAVDTMGAIDVLRTHSPSAAKWWERNTPHLLKEGKRFCFEASCCEDIAPEVIYSS